MIIMISLGVYSRSPVCAVSSFAWEALWTETIQNWRSRTNDWKPYRIAKLVVQKAFSPRFCLYTTSDIYHCRQRSPFFPKNRRTLYYKLRSLKAHVDGFFFFFLKFSRPTSTSSLHLYLLKSAGLKCLGQLSPMVDKYGTISWPTPANMHCPSATMYTWSNIANNLALGVCMEHIIVRPPYARSLSNDTHCELDKSSRPL